MTTSAPSDSVSFADLGLSELTLNALRNVQFDKPSPIQAAFIPLAMSGIDCIGQAHTGTGKTAAFVLPLLERLNFDNRTVQALVLAPTRELSEQIANECKRLSYSSMCRSVCIVGGRPIRSQINELEKGVHIAIGTPGRVIDLIEPRRPEFAASHRRDSGRSGSDARHRFSSRHRKDSATLPGRAADLDAHRHDAAAR